MTVSAQAPIGGQTANGVTTSFPFGYLLLSEEDLVVLVDGVQVSTGFTVSGVGNAEGGQIIFDTAPLNGVKIVHYRASLLRRSSDYQDNGDLLAPSLNADFDALWLVLQEIASGVNGIPTALRAPSGETLEALPAAEDRANRVQAYNSEGAPIVIAGVDSGSAAALALDLANSASAVKGAGAVAYGAALPYARNSVGAKLQERPSPEDYGAVGDGVADDSAAFVDGWSDHTALFGKPGSIYRVKDLQANGRKFYGNGSILTWASGARWGVRLEGYQPGIYDVLVQDNDNIAKATTAASTTASPGDTVTVASAAGVEAGQVALVEVDGAGSWQVTEVESVVGLAVTLRDALSSDVSSGNRLIFGFGGIVIGDSAAEWTLTDVRTVNARCAYLIKPQSTSGVSNKGTGLTVTCDGIRYFGLVKQGNAAGVKLDDVKLWGGYNEVIDNTGNGTAGPFTVSSDPVYLKRDVTVTVNGVAKTRPTHWEFSSSTQITFTSGNFPSVGAAIQSTNFRDGIRGFVDDHRNATTISGGNDYGEVEVLDCLIGTELFEAELTDFSNLIVDTCQYVGLNMVSCPTTLNINKAFLGYNGANAKSFASSANMGRVYTKRVPTADTVSGVVDNNIEIDATSKLDIDVGQWTGGDYQVAGAGYLNPRNGKTVQCFSTPGAAIGAGVTRYLTHFGTSIAPPTQGWVAPCDTHILEIVCAATAAPGVGQTYTYRATVAGAATGPTLVVSGSTFGGTLRLELSVLKGQTVDVQVVTSAGASGAEHRCAVTLR